MTRRTLRIAAASTIALALVSSQAFAGSSLKETHAFLDGQRTITDGQAVPLDLRADVKESAGRAREMSASDRWFLFQLARAEGNTEPTPREEQAKGSPFDGLHALVRAFR